jgi:hypothetical protein
MAFENINWNLAAPVDVGGAFQTGFQHGQDMRQQADSKNALAAFGANPSMQTANALMPVDPRLGMQARAQVAEQEATQRKQAVMQRVAQGDHSALTELAGLDPEMWSRLDGQHREKIKQATGFMGQAVLQVSRLPEEQRAQAWASYVQQAEAGGMDIPTQFERYSPEAMNAAAAEAGTMEKLIKQFEPDWHFSPNGGLVNFADPKSIQGYGQWMSKGAQGGATPPATLAPDFDFGAGGPTQPASGTFP